MPGADRPSPRDLADRDLLAEVAREAGALALSFFGQAPKAWTKAGDSPVTEADIAVDRLLHQRLLGARPDYGWLSEETADSAARLDSARLFVVDPIDGTRGFIGGRTDWTVSLAVVDGGRPVAAALFAPVTGDLYAAAAGAGATRNGNLLGVTLREAPAEARVASGKVQVGRALPEFKEIIPRVASLALRLALVAAGEIDAAFASTGSHDWDIACADLLVSEAGGRLTSLDGAPPAYNCPHPRHPPLVAAGPRLHGAILREVARG